MTTFARSLFAAFALTLAVFTDAPEAQAQTAFVRVPFPTEIPFHIVVRYPAEMQQAIDQRINPDNPSVTWLGFNEFKDKARGREVTLFTGDMCTRAYSQRHRRLFTTYNIRLSYFKGNRMYYTDVDMTDVIKKAVAPGLVGRRWVDPDERYINIQVKHPDRWLCPPTLASVPTRRFFIPLAFTSYWTITNALKNTIFVL